MNALLLFGSERFFSSGTNSAIYLKKKAEKKRNVLVQLTLTSKASSQGWTKKPAWSVEKHWPSKLMKEIGRQ